MLDMIVRLSDDQIFPLSSSFPFQWPLVYLILPIRPPRSWPRPRGQNHCSSSFPRKNCTTHPESTVHLLLARPELFRSSSVAAHCRLDLRELCRSCRPWRPLELEVWPWLLRSCLKLRHGRSAQARSFELRLLREEGGGGDRLNGVRTGIAEGMEESAGPGIYVGGGHVIHFTRTGVDKTSLDCFRREGEKLHSLRSYAYGRPLLEYWLTRLGTRTTLLDTKPPEEVVNKAWELYKGDSFGEYNLFSNNCEHFATFCKTGNRASAQTTLINAFELKVKGVKDWAIKDSAGN
ncbi:hypothetical protein NL676_020379 [Syzygium grande]|nr:hypothetical protein NL676_020379 [Syzygium grande]